MGILILLMIPGLIVFDLIPKVFRHKGLTDWYIDKYKIEADALIFFVYLPFCVFIGWLIYIFN